MKTKDIVKNARVLRPKLERGNFVIRASSPSGL